MSKCANVSCNREFEKKTHNNIYCSPECCKIATNRKIMERYHKKKAMRGKPQECSSDDCQNVLSKYNVGGLCSECEAKKKSDEMSAIKDMFSAY